MNISLTQYGSFIHPLQCIPFKEKNAILDIFNSKFDAFQLKNELSFIDFRKFQSVKLATSNPINAIALIKIVSDLGELPIRIVGMDGNILVPLNNLLTGNIR